MNMQVPNIFGTRQGSATQAPVGTAGRGDGIPGSDEPDLIIHGRGIPGPQALWQILQMAQMMQPPGNDGDMALNIVIGRSEDDQVHERDEDVQLDIECRGCRRDEADQKCPICQSQFKMDEELSTLDDCPHTFHYQCIFEWGKYNQICPVCRKEIPVI
jgi:hypothetical protein